MDRALFSPLPWQRAAWESLWARRETWSHALLLTGYVGSGKRQFAQALAAALLCDQPSEAHIACGQCQSCQWLQADSHPEYQVLAPVIAEDDEEGPKKRAKAWIEIKQVRALGQLVQLSSRRVGGALVILILTAEQLNREAANALLKTLEEPMPGVVFILVADQLGRVLPTIRSRCRLWALPGPTESEAAQYMSAHTAAPDQALLALAGGQPLLAVTWHEPLFIEAWQLARAWFTRPQADALHMASEWVKWPLPWVYDWLVKWVYDLISWKLANVVRYHPSESANFARLAEHCDLYALLRFQQALQAERRVLTHPLNAKWLLESWLLTYRGLFSRRGA